MSEELRGVELSVEKLVPGGDGFARLSDGRVLFVKLGVPGDRIRLGAVERERGALVARNYELLTAGPARVNPECAIASTCGGCDLMHVARNEELSQKRRMLQEALVRVGGVTFEPPALTADAPLGYRARVRFHVGKQGKLGFFARGSHQLVEVQNCAVADPRINAALALVRRMARRYPEALRGFSDIELRATQSEVIARFVPRDGIKPVAAEPLLRALAKELRVVATEREAQSVSERRQVTADTYVQVPADAFSQVNVAVNERLVAAVVEGCRARGLATFCDLFAGVGNFALPLARAGLSGVMVEKTPSAVKAAERAALEQGLTGLRARSADVAQALADLVREGKRFDLVVLDPPREGAPDVVAGVSELGPRAIAYVSCDPVTLSRDLKPLLASGLRVASVEAFDMFPRTHHFETLVWLEA